MDTSGFNRLLAEYGPKFPPPPFEGTDAIVPITTLAALRMEGKTMHHCVFSYASQIFAGNTTIYQVFDPERATLRLTKEPYGWRLSEMALACNRTPAPETWSMTRAWMEKAVKTIQDRI